MTRVGSRDEAGSGGFAEKLFAPIDIASLAVFRIGFGLIALFEVYSYFAKGWG